MKKKSFFMLPYSLKERKKKAGNVSWGITFLFWYSETSLARCSKQHSAANSFSIISISVSFFFSFSQFSCKINSHRLSWFQSFLNSLCQSLFIYKKKTTTLFIYKKKKQLYLFIKKKQQLYLFIKKNFFLANSADWLIDLMTYQLVWSYFMPRG